MSDVAEFGVVFDCDGVLVNTEEIGWQVWRSLASEYGLEVGLEDLRAVTGCTDEESVRYFGKWLSEPGLSELGARFRDAFVAAKRHGTRSYPDAVAVLWELQAREIPVAVASNSTSLEVEATLDRADLSGLVDEIVGVDQVESPKPAPDLYELAASRLACDMVVAVEDSPVGIASARAAGLPVLGVDRGVFFDASSLTEATAVARRISYAFLKSLTAQAA